MEGPHEEIGSTAEVNTSESDGNGTDREPSLSDDDPDFSDSGNELDSEGDDFLYEENVTDGIELGSNAGLVDNVVQNELEGNVDIDVDDLEYPSSEEMNLADGASDDEVGYRFPEFSVDVDMNNPQFQVGQLFRDVAEFKNAVRAYGALNGYNVRFNCNDERRAQGICKRGCNWRIWASKLGDTGSVQVKSYSPEHTCSRDKYNRHCNYQFLTRRYIERFKADPNWKTKSILAAVKEDLRTDITRNVAWKMRRYANELLHGTIEEQFALLWSYGSEVLRTNPGSNVTINTFNDVFQGIYICFEPCKTGFIRGCRKMIGVDGCHLRGCFGGILLTAVGLDANDCIYPIAYAVVQKENTPSWMWFMRLLAADLQIGTGDGWTIMTDRQKGLQNVVDELLPQSEHRFCVRHMYSNFFSTGFKGKTLKDYLWRAAKSSTISDYKHWMTKIRQVSEEAFKWLMERPPQEWSKSHFKVHSKCDTLLNNVCEVFNKTLLEDREKMILSMLTSMQLTFMRRIQIRRDKMRSYVGKLCPKIKKRVRTLVEKSRECIVHFSGGPMWQVETSSGSFVVDLEARTCACRKWELTGIPCLHAMAVILECRNEPEDYVDNCYTTETYLNCYENILNPINGQNLWPEFNAGPINPPKWKVPKKGQRQKKRRKNTEEVVVHSQGKSYIRKKGHVSMTCSVCGVRGHNKRYHSSTPTVTSRAASEGASSVGQRASNVDEMVDNFEEIQAAESSQLRAARARGRRRAKMAASTSRRPS